MRHGEYAHQVHRIELSGISLSVQEFNERIGLDKNKPRGALREILGLAPEGLHIELRI